MDKVEMEGNQEPCDTELIINTERNQANSLTAKKDDRLLGYSIDKHELKYLKFIFLILGYGGVINWQTTTNCIQTVYATIYDNPNAASTMLLPYVACTTLLGLIKIYFKNISLWSTKLGILILFFTNLATPIIIQFAPKESGPALLHINIALVGIGAVLVQGNFSAYGFLLPYNFFGLMVAGSGLGGLLAFSLWQFMIRLFFDTNVPDELITAVWIYYCFNVFSILLVASLFAYLLRKPWFKGSIKIFNDTKRIRISNDQSESNETSKNGSLEKCNATDLGMRSFHNLIKKSTPYMALTGLSFFITYAIYPNVGPYGWSTTYDNRSLLVGIYQVLDFIGRYLPNMGKRFLIPVKVLIFLIFFRLIFLPIWIYFSQIDSEFTSNLITQVILMILFAVLSGYLTVLPIVHVGKDLRTVAERGYMGLIQFVATQLWLILGLGFSNFIIYIFQIEY